MSELGAVEQTLDLLQSNLKPSGHTPSSAKQSLPPPGPPPTGPSTLDEADQLATDVQRTNDVTFDERFTGPSPVIMGNSSLLLRNQQAAPPGLVFPSVKNKPSADAASLDGADTLLTGVSSSLTISTYFLP